MANLIETAELFWRQMFPEPNDETALKKYEIIATAKQIYAYSVWEQSMLLRSSSDFEIPSQLVERKKLPVKEGRVDISQLNIQKGFPFDSWAIHLKGGCDFIKTTANSVNLIDPEDLSTKRYLIEGDFLTFPDGIFDKEVTFLYAGMGDGIDGEIKISDEQGDIIRRRLIEIYIGRTGQEDLTSNSNPNG